jgi:hypothetical protein
MPDGMGEWKLCFLASLQLCDKECFNAEGAKEQRGRGVLGCLRHGGMGTLLLSISATLR